MFRQSQLRRAPVLFRQASRLLSSGASAQTTFNSNDVVILSTSRTPIGTFNGSLASLTAPQLGTIVAKDALRKAGVKPEEVDEALLGNVLSAGLGQAPARQVVLRSGLPPSVSCTTINKVCSSGMKSIMFAAQSIQTGYNKRVVLAGGFESMSNVPYYLTKARSGYGYGHQEMKDGVLMDGLWDAFDDHHMGNCAEVCAEKYKISRQELDAYAIESYRRAQQATKEGWFKDEIVPVELPAKKGSKDVKTVTVDEQTSKLDANKVPNLKPVFKKDGVVTAANSSALNDGAAAFVLTSGHYAAKNNLKPIARILGYADAERAPIEFTTAPADAIPKALRNAGIKKEDVDFFEINEAFAAVNLANYKLLGLDPAKCNVHGGAIALGHPIGASGARIVTTLLHVLKRRKGRIGVAGICNGGGGASAIVVERAPDWQ